MKIYFFSWEIFNNLDDPTEKTYTSFLYENDNNEPVSEMYIRLHTETAAENGVPINQIIARAFNEIT